MIAKTWSPWQQKWFSLLSYGGLFSCFLWLDEKKLVSNDFRSAFKNLNNSKFVISRCDVRGFWEKMGPIAVQFFLFKLVLGLDLFSLGRVGPAQFFFYSHYLVYSFYPHYLFLFSFLLDWHWALLLYYKWNYEIFNFNSSFYECFFLKYVY